MKAHPLPTVPLDGKAILTTNRSARRCFFCRQSRGPGMLQWRKASRSWLCIDLDLCWRDRCRYMSDLRTWIERHYKKREALDLFCGSVRDKESILRADGLWPIERSESGPAAVVVKSGFKKKKGRESKPPT